MKIRSHVHPSFPFLVCINGMLRCPLCPSPCWLLMNPMLWFHRCVSFEPSQEKVCVCDLCVRHWARSVYQSQLYRQCQVCALPLSLNQHNISERETETEHKLWELVRENRGLEWSECSRKMRVVYVTNDKCSWLEQWRKGSERTERLN